MARHFHRSDFSHGDDDYDITDREEDFYNCEDCENMYEAIDRETMERYEDDVDGPEVFATDMQDELMELTEYLADTTECFKQDKDVSALEEDIEFVTDKLDKIKNMLSEYHNEQDALAGR